MLRFIMTAAAILIGTPSSAEEFFFRFDFNVDERWHGGVVDYGILPEDYTFELGYARLPEYLSPAQNYAYLLSGFNGSGDTLWYIKENVGLADGLEQDRTYRVKRVKVALASNARAGCEADGISPGDAVVLKFAASSTEPIERASDGDGAQLTWRLAPIDIGNHSQTGKHSILLGDISNGDNCEGPAVYKSIVREARDTGLRVNTGKKGDIWFVVAADSNHVGATRLLIQSVEITLAR